MLEVFSVSRLVQAVTQRVEDVALDFLTDRHRDRISGVGDLDPPDQAVSGLKRDRADQVFPQVLRDLERQGLGEGGEGDLGVQRVEQLRHRSPGELDIDDRAGDAYDAAGGVGVGLAGLYGSSTHIFFASSGAYLAASASAFAPPTISLISWVIWACRSRLASSVRALMRSSALSVADFIAR